MPGPFLDRALLTATLIAFVAPSIGPARANPVIDWNIVAIDATAVPPNSVLQSRTLAIVHGAIFDAIHAVAQEGPAYAVDLEAPPGTSIEAAVGRLRMTCSCSLPRCSSRSSIRRWRRL